MWSRDRLRQFFVPIIVPLKLGLVVFGAAGCAIDNSAILQPTAEALYEQGGAGAYEAVEGFSNTFVERVRSSSVNLIVWYKTPLQVENKLLYGYQATGNVILKESGILYIATSMHDRQYTDKSNIDSILVNQPGVKNSTQLFINDQAQFDMATDLEVDQQVIGIRHGDTVSYGTVQWTDGQDPPQAGTVLYSLGFPAGFFIDTNLDSTPETQMCHSSKLLVDTDTLKRKEGCCGPGSYGLKGIADEGESGKGIMMELPEDVDQPLMIAMTTRIETHSVLGDTGVVVVNKLRLKSLLERVRASLSQQ